MASEGPEGAEPLDALKRLSQDARRGHDRGLTGAAAYRAVLDDIDTIREALERLRSAGAQQESPNEALDALRRVEIDLGLRMEMRHYPEVIARDIATIRSALRSNTGAQPASEERERLAAWVEARAVAMTSGYGGPIDGEALDNLQRIARALRSSPPVAPGNEVYANGDTSIERAYRAGFRAAYKAEGVEDIGFADEDHHWDEWSREFEPPTPPGAARPQEVESTARRIYRDQRERDLADHREREAKLWEQPEYDDPHAGDER